MVWAKTEAEVGRKKNVEQRVENYALFTRHRTHTPRPSRVLMYLLPQEHTNTAVGFGFSVHLPSLRKFFDIQLFIYSERFILNEVEGS